MHCIVPQRRELGIRDCVLGFDIRDDKFFELPQPDYENKGMNFQVDVGVLEGNLCVMCNYEHVCVDVWVMKEYGVKESWCKMFSVHAVKWISAFMFLRPLVYSKGGDMVLLEVNAGKLLWYDWKNKHAKCHGFNFSSQKQTSRGSLAPLDSVFPSHHLCLPIN